MTAVLQLDGVTRRYGGVCAVDDVTLEVAGGERHVVIGPNGAGKTTLFKLISRLESVSDGRIRVFERDVTRMSPAPGRAPRARPHVPDHPGVRGR